MSAAIASRRSPRGWLPPYRARPRRSARATLGCYEPAHIVGVSKTAYVPATPRCLEWRRDLQRASTNSTPPDPDSHAESRGSARVLGAIAAALGHQLPASCPRLRRPRGPASPTHVLRREPHAGVDHLDPALLGALRKAATDAADDGIEFFIESGWRSPEHQEQLFREAVSNTARKQKLPAGWPPPTSLLTCRGTRSTSGLPLPRSGCPHTAPRTGSARSTATSPGTTNCARRPSLTAARPCTPTLRKIQGCSSEPGVWPRQAVNLAPGQHADFRIMARVP